VKSSLRSRSQFFPLMLLSAALLVAQGSAQSAAAAQKPVAIRTIKLWPGPEGPVLEIVSSAPLYPKIEKLDSPPRLVIDLPRATFSLARRRFAYRNDRISAVRVDQFQNDPPITRLVVDLLKPVEYAWDASGNDLIVRLRPGTETTQYLPHEPPAVKTLTESLQPAAVPITPSGSGTAVLAGNQLAGASLSAGAETTLFHLSHGGEVRVCPRTTVSVTSSQNGRDLLLAMSTGAIEGHYKLETSSDSVLTPDFRVVLAGPGEFHYAIRADAHGNTCVRALPGNTASVAISELIGGGTYQMKPGDQVRFRSGRLDMMDTSADLGEDCGCPPPPIPVMRASTRAPAEVQEAGLPASVRLAQPDDPVKPVPPPVSSSAPSPPPSPGEGQLSLPLTMPDPTPLPPSGPSDIHVKLEAPLVYRAPGSQPNPPPSPQTNGLPLASANSAPLLTTVPAPQKPENRGFFRKVRGFLGGIFH
jgi:AMIN domain-containing protein